MLISLTRQATSQAQIRLIYCGLQSSKVEGGVLTGRDLGIETFSFVRSLALLPRHGLVCNAPGLNSVQLQ